MLCQINKKDTKELMNYLNSRNQEISSDILIRASKIIEDVRMNGDEACKKYTKQFDGIDIDSFKVTQEEIDQAILKCDPLFCESMKKAKGEPL